MICDQILVTQTDLFLYLLERTFTEHTFSSTEEPFMVVTTIINHEVSLLINTGPTGTDLPVTNVVLLKGLEDMLSGIPSSTIIAELIKNPCAVLPKQPMAGLLLDQFGGQNHTTKLVFLVHGSNLQEVTAAGTFRTGLVIRYGQLLRKEGSVHMEMLILTFGV